jgi:hypothetical protein
MGEMGRQKVVGSNPARATKRIRYLEKRDSCTIDFVDATLK